jgi:murein L,D-transpeptidase YafK
MLGNVPRLLFLFSVSVGFNVGAQAPVHSPAHADRIVVVKSTHTMTLYVGGKELKVYHVWLGRGPGNAKQQQGDNETPEGSYTITGRNPHSAAYRSLRISYPNAADRERARKLHVNPGGDIMIHGLPAGNDWVKPGQVLPDWTYGCIAVTDSEMDEIWKLVPDGTPIEIRH